MQESQVKQNIERNFYRIPVAPRSTTIKEWEKLEPSQIYELLLKCQPRAHHEAKELIMHMVTKRWTLTATAHDTGSKKQNDRLHISIKIGNWKPHHLYCREIPGRGLQITKITKG